MKKRFLSLLLCLSLLLACVPAVCAYSGVSAWAQEAVSAMSELGFLPGELQNADLSKNITRGEMCKMAVLVYQNLMGDNAYPDSTKFFTDTNDPLINYAGEQGIVGGIGDGKFAPNEFLKRQDFFKIVYNMMGTALWTPSGLNLDDLGRFSDVGQISSYALDPTKVMVTIGVVQGAGNNLNPKSTTTRQEAILMFFRAYLYMGQWINSQNEETKVIQIQAQGYTAISTWAIREVQEMQSKGMIPDRLDNCNMSRGITRAEMCSIAVLAYAKATGKQLPAGTTNYFTDCSERDVNVAYELKIVGGYGDGRFGPNDTLTREQFFKIMANFMLLLGYPRTDTRAVALSNYTDGSKVSSWAQAPTRLLIYTGAVTGDGKNLTPKSNTAVQEAIAVFLRCYKFTTAWTAAHPNGLEEWEEPTVMDELLAFAKSFEGYPYVYGGNGPNNFDCSGFVLYVYKHFGYSFARGAQEQYHGAKLNVGYDDLQPGDLVFFCGYKDADRSNFRSITHVGLYLGEGKFIHASNPTRGVVIDTLWSGHYQSVFFGGARIIFD